MIKVHTDTFGVTQRALKALRDELADRIDHKIEVWQLPASDGEEVECYGLVIYDFTDGEVVVIGDGFRGDGGGEGGSGHRAAQALLAIYGLSTLSKFEQRVTFREDDDWAFLLAYLGGKADISERSGTPTAPRDRRPHYIDHVLRR